MIELGNHNEDLIRDAHLWEHVACSPLDGVMLFKHRDQAYTIYTWMHSVTVTENGRPGGAFLRLRRRRIRPSDGRPQS